MDNNNGFFSNKDCLGTLTFFLFWHLSKQSPFGHNPITCTGDTVRAWSPPMEHWTRVSTKGKKDRRDLRSSLDKKSNIGLFGQGLAGHSALHFLCLAELLGYGAQLRGRIQGWETRTQISFSIGCRKLK